MLKIVISDTSSLILFHKIGELELLRKVYNKVKPFIDKLLSTDFRISESIINELLKINNEITGD